MKRKFSKKVISILLVFAMLIGGACLSCTSAAAFDLDYISEDGMKLGYSINQGLFQNVDEKRSVLGRENCRLLWT